jgi:hypothetical protein
VIVVNSSYAGLLAFELDSYDLKVLNATGSPNIYNLLSATGSNSTIDNFHMSTFDMGFNGFGVPRIVYMNFLNAFNYTLFGKFSCLNDIGYGDFCVSDFPC